MLEPRCAGRSFNEPINRCHRLQEFLALLRPREVGGGSRDGLKGRGMMGRGQQRAAAQGSEIREDSSQIHGEFRDARAGPETTACGLPCASSKRRNARRAPAGRRAAVFHPSPDLPASSIPASSINGNLPKSLPKAAKSPRASQMGKRSPREAAWLAPSHEA